MITQKDIAEELAYTHHRGQFRRDGVTPYVDHVVEVARIVKQRGGDDIAQAMAFAHDLGENCNLTGWDLQNAGLNEDVVYGIDLLTLKESLSYEENIWIIKLSGNQRVIQVKIADNLANLSDAPTDKQILKYAKSLQILMS